MGSRGNNIYTMSLTNFPNGIMGFPVVGASILDMFGAGKTYFVDGDLGAAGNDGLSPSSAISTIQGAVTAAAVNGGNATIYVKALKPAAGNTDPVSYSENVIIPATCPNTRIVGVSVNRTQGGLPQLLVGATTTSPLITVRASNCMVMNMGINGIGGTGGGILLDDDDSTKSAYGTSILNCHFKNCVGTTATNAATGGAIMWAATGSAWGVLIKGNRFYKNVGDVVLKGTSVTVPQDVVIEDNVFSGPAASVDCNLYLAGGSGMNGLVIRNNSFTCFPAIGSGTNAKQLALTGCVGFMSGNRFATSSKTFGAAGNNLVPTTMFMAENYQEVAAGAGATGEIGRT